MLSESLYADNSVLISETNEKLRNNYSKWKEAFECKGLNVKLG